MDIKAISLGLRKMPPLDIAICSECNRQYKVSDCPKDEEGDWESGYYEVDLCPVCEDGGCIDDYCYSPEQLKVFKAWEKRTKGA